MTEPTKLALELSKQDIEKIIHSAIEAQVATTMKANGDVIIAQYVGRLLTEKVDESGKPSSYSSYGKPFLQWISEKTLREATADAVKQWCEEHKPMIEKAVKAALTRNKDKLAEQAAQMLVSSGHYGLSVAVSFAKVGNDR
jgi:hypothetical protein